MVVSNPLVLKGILRFTPKFTTRHDWTDLPYATYDTKGLIRQNEDFELELVFNFPGLTEPVEIISIIDDSDTPKRNENYYFNNYKFFQLERNVLIMIATFNWYHPPTYTLYQFAVTGRLRGFANHRLQTWDCKSSPSQKTITHGK